MEAVEVGGLGVTGWFMVTGAQIFSSHSCIPNIWPSSKGLVLQASYPSCRLEEGKVEGHFFPLPLPLKSLPRRSLISHWWECSHMATPPELPCPPHGSRPRPDYPGHILAQLSPLAYPISLSFTQRFLSFSSISHRTESLPQALCRGKII